MPKRSTVKIEGLDALLKDLQNADSAIENALVKGVSDAAKIVETDMSKRASKLPWATGDLAFQTTIKNTYIDDRKVTALVGPGKGGGHAFFAEVGTRGHKKESKKQQYARPAVDNNRKKIRNAIFDAAAWAFERAVRR